MQIAIVLFDRFTALDAVGTYEILSRTPGAETVFVAERTGAVRNDNSSLDLVAHRTFDEVPAPDLVIVPGGPGQHHQMENENLLGGCAARTSPPPGRPPSAPDRCCWRRPGS